MAPNHNHNNGFTCPVCGTEQKKSQWMHGDLVRPVVIDLIHQDHPDWDPRQGICLGCLNHARANFVQKTLEDEKGELTQFEKDVVASLHDQEPLTQNLNDQMDEKKTFGERLADKMAEFGGSWNFILIFGAILAVWILINTLVLFYRPFDPYPYILLNLILSCLASIQAPVIMMSQNRQESRDRLRANNDYLVNLKAELEIRQINAKMDQLLTHQWQRLMEIQQVQTELMEEVVQFSGRRPRPETTER